MVACEESVGSTNTDTDGRFWDVLRPTNARSTTLIATAL